MVYKAKPAPKGYMTVTDLSRKSGYTTVNIRHLFRRNKLRGKRVSHSNSPTGDRILIANDSALQLISGVLHAKEAQLSLNGTASVSELSGLTGVPACAIRVGCRKGKISGAKKVGVTSNGKGGQWKMPWAVVGRLDATRLRALLAAKTKPRKVPTQNRKPGRYYTPAKASKKLNVDGTSVDRRTINRWVAAGKITPDLSAHGVSFFHETQLPALRELAGNSRVAKSSSAKNKS